MEINTPINTGSRPPISKPPAGTRPTYTPRPTSGAKTPAVGGRRISTTLPKATKPPLPAQIKKGYLGRVTPDGRQLVKIKGRAVAVPLRGVTAGAPKTIRASTRTAVQKQKVTARLQALSAKKPAGAYAARKAANFCCFVAGTQVATKDGLRGIETIKLGDLVLSKDEVTGQTAFKPVTALIPGHDRDIFVLTVETTLPSGDKRVSSFETTNDHPWRSQDGQWLETQNLDAGIPIQTAYADAAKVVSVVNANRKARAFNIEVADFHTYFVGSERVWVHNECRPNLNRIALAIQRNQAPITVKRLDKADRGVTGEQPHVHFKDGAALNLDGTWKHNSRNLTRVESRWLDSIGWKRP